MIPRLQWTTAATALLLTCGLSAQTSNSTATTHRRAAAAAHKAVSPPAPAEPVVGTSAIGTMPAAVGAVKPLFALRYIDLQPGTGELARPNMFYTVHYTGWLLNGTKFDSSVDRNQPFVFPAGARRVILGWDMGFEGMRVGGKRRLIVPYQLAYGEDGRPPVIPAKSDLIFDVELIAQSETQSQQPQPTPPANADPAKPAAPASANPKPAAQPGTNPINQPAEKPE